MSASAAPGRAVTARGSCLCGAVRYRVEGPLRPVVACHCVQCRKTSGNFVAATSALQEDVILEREDGLRWYESSAQARRGFCGVCGSSLFWATSDSARLSLHAGALDEAEGLSLIGHIFCADKGGYYEIADGLPQRPGDDAKLTTQ
ncbi:MAG: GFA family protein [Pseudomonadota bacterium]